MTLITIQNSDTIGMKSVAKNDASKMPKSLSAMQNAVAKTAVSLAGGAKAQKAFTAAANAAASAIKNVSLRFDELNVANQGIANKGNSSGGGSEKKGSAKKAAAKDAEEQLSAWENFCAAVLAHMERLESTMRNLFAPSITAWSAALGVTHDAFVSAFAGMQLAAQSLWDNALAPLGNYILTSFIPGLVNAFSTTMAPILAGFASVLIPGVALAFQAACEIIMSLVNAIILPALMGISTAFGMMCTAVCDAWNQYGVPLMTGIGRAIENIVLILQNFYNTIILPVLLGIGEAASALWNEHLAPLWANFISMFDAVGVSMLTLWNEVIAPFINSMITIFGPAVSAVLAGIASSFSGVFGVAADVVSGIINVLSQLMQFIANVFTGNWSGAWENIKNIFSGVWGSIVSLLKGAINLIIDCVNTLTRGVAAGINGVVGALNGLHITVPKWVPIYGGKNFSFNLPSIGAPQIPRLARGAVIPPNAEFLAVLGDQKSGRNLEAPEALLRQIVREEMGNGQSFTAEQPINLSLDGSVFYRAMMKIDLQRGARVGGAFAYEY